MGLGWVGDVGVGGHCQGISLHLSYFCQNNCKYMPRFSLSTKKNQQFCLVQFIFVIFKG